MGRPSVQTLLYALSVLEGLPETSPPDVRAAFLPGEERLKALATPILRTGPSHTAFAAHREPLVGFLRHIKPQDPNQDDCTTIVSDNRTAALQYSWLVPHFLLLSLIARDALVDTQPCRWTTSSDLPALVAISDRASRHLMSLAVSELPTDWHTAAIRSLSEGGIPRTGVTAALAPLLGEHPHIEHGLNFYRTSAALLGLALRAAGTSREDAEAWLDFGRALQRKDFNRSLTVVFAVTPFCVASQRLGRYQSELASTITGLKDSDMNEQGLELL